MIGHKGYKLPGSLIPYVHPPALVDIQRIVWRFYLNAERVCQLLRKAISIAGLLPGAAGQQPDFLKISLFSEQIKQILLDLSRTSKNQSKSVQNTCDFTKSRRNQTVTRIFKAFRVQLAHAEPPKEKRAATSRNISRHPFFHRAFIQRSFFDTA